MSASNQVTPNGQLHPGFYPRHRFAILLIVLLTVVLASPALLALNRSAIWFDGLIALMVFASILPFCVDRRERFFALVFGIPTVALLAGGHALPDAGSRWVILVAHLCAVLFFFGAAVVVVKVLVQSEELYLDSMFGVTCGYLFLGLAWGAVYAMVEAARPHSFEIKPSLLEANAGAHDSLFTYYSFVTLTTMGYGDITPLSPLARTFAWLEAITGQLYVAIIVAGVVSLLVANSAEQRRRSEMNDEH